MRRQNTRFRIDSNGRLETVDPGLDTLPLLCEIDPSYSIRHGELIGYAGRPKVRKTRVLPCGIARDELCSKADDELWRKHGDLMSRMHRQEIFPAILTNEASLLDLKQELARRVLMHCELCAHRCGSNRVQGELGRCLLGMGAVVAEHFVHIGEEAPINPSLVLSLAGCGLRCRFCQQSAILDPRKVLGESLDSQLWEKLDLTEARSLSFVGGNPDESLYAILDFLAAMPENWELPVVWNSHAYSTWQTLSLLDGVVDVYIPDFKYGNDDACGRSLSLCKDYFVNATESIQAMLQQQVPVIVRVLVLPGHFECCHRPVLNKLAQLNCPWLSVSVRGQYCPDWKISADDGELSSRPGQEQIDAVKREALKLNLTLVN